MTLLLVRSDLTALVKFHEAVATVGEGKALQWASWAMNQVGNKMRTQIIRSLVQQTGLAYGEVLDQIATERASPGNLRYAVTGSGRYFGVGHFGPSQQARGVKAAPWRKRRLFPGAFLAGGRVFARVGPERLPIKFLYGPAVPREMERDAVPQDFIAAAEHELPAAVERKFNQMLPW